MATAVASMGSLRGFCDGVGMPHSLLAPSEIGTKQNQPPKQLFTAEGHVQGPRKLSDTLAADFRDAFYNSTKLGECPTAACTKLLHKTSPYKNMSTFRGGGKNNIAAVRAQSEWQSCKGASRPSL